LSSHKILVNHGICFILGGVRIGMNQTLTYVSHSHASPRPALTWILLL